MKQLRLTLLLFYCSLVAVAQLPKSSKLSQPPKPSQTPVVRFDSQMESLPPKCLGNNAETIYGLISQKLRNPNRTAFESTHDYEGRLDEFASTPISGYVKPTDQIAFVLGQSVPELTSDNTSFVFGKISTEYDADAQRLTVKVPLDPLADAWSTVWKRTWSFLGSYIGSNLFGVRKKINRYNDYSTEIVVDDFDWLKSDCEASTTDISCEIQADTATARDFSSHARVLVIGNLMPPFISSQESTSEPTIDTPSEVHHHYKLLYLKLEQVWLFNERTGKVLARFSRQRHAAAYPVNVVFRLKEPSSPWCKSGFGGRKRLWDAQG